MPHSTLLERVGNVEELSLYASSVISRTACLSSSYSSFEDVPVKVKLKLRSSMHAWPGFKPNVPVLQLQINDVEIISYFTRYPAHHAAPFSREIQSTPLPDAAQGHRAV